MLLLDTSQGKSAMGGGIIPDRLDGNKIKEQELSELIPFFYRNHSSLVSYIIDWCYRNNDVYHLGKRRTCA